MLLRAICLGVAIAVCVAIVSAGRPLPKESYYASDKEYTVSISQGDHTVTTIHVPVGVYMGIDFDQESSPEASDSTLRVTYRGDVTIRLRPTSEGDELQGKSLQDILATAPIVMALRDCQVVVDTRR